MFRATRVLLRWPQTPRVGQRTLSIATRAVSAPAPGERAVVDNIGLELEEIDKNLFRSKSLWTPAGARGVYGGQVIGQALMAAHATLEDDIPIHSMHSYFLLPGDASRPIVYSVNRLRDGKSFTARSVIAKQNGTPIFNCQASFHRPEASPICHQDPMPDAPAPESVPSFDEQLRGLLAEPGLKGRYRAVIQKLLEHPFGMEVRNVTVPDIRHPPEATKTQLMWMRTASPMGDNRNLHKCTVAFASDWGLGVTSLLPHGVVFPSRAVKMVASLDHSVWFHSDNFRADEWLLYEMYTSRAHGGRGLNFGRLFNRQGELVMSFAQEAVIRMREPWVQGTEAADDGDDAGSGGGASAAGSASSDATPASSGAAAGAGATGASAASSPQHTAAPSGRAHDSSAGAGGAGATASRFVNDHVRSAVASATTAPPRHHSGGTSPAGTSSTHAFPDLWMQVSDGYDYCALQTC